jgi:hypothetical protein
MQTTVEFTPFPKIPRLFRDIVITEKIDGTNAAIIVAEDTGEVWAQSRNRIITPEKDNYGFARWVYDNQGELADTLGPGTHFGEWWGQGIQRRYDQETKHFSLFNTHRWGELFPAGSDGLLKTVPVLYEGEFSEVAIQQALWGLRIFGSVAAPWFDRPEGIVIYHRASNNLFKVTLEHDQAPKGLTPAQGVQVGSNNVQVNNFGGAK